MLKTKPGGSLKPPVPSCFCAPLGPGGQRSGVVAERALLLDRHSPEGPGGAAPGPSSCLGLALAMPKAPHPPTPPPHSSGTAVLPLPSRHHSRAGPGGRPSGSLQLQRGPFLARTARRLSGCAVPRLLPPAPPPRPPGGPTMCPRSRAVLTRFLGRPLHLLRQVLQAFAGHGCWGLRGTSG